MTSTDREIDSDSAEKMEQLIETVKTIVSDPEVCAEEAFYAALVMESSEMDDIYRSEDRFRQRREDGTVNRNGEDHRLRSRSMRGGGFLCRAGDGIFRDG